MSDLMSSHDLFQDGQFSPAAKKRGNAHLKVWTEHVLDERCISEDLEGPAVNPSKAQKYDASEVLWLVSSKVSFVFKARALPAAQSRWVISPEKLVVKLRLQALQPTLVSSSHQSLVLLQGPERLLQASSKQPRAHRATDPHVA